VEISEKVHLVGFSTQVNNYRTKHGMYNIKIINAQQAKIINNFKNLKEKVLRDNAAMWFNKTCRARQLTPKYINIKVNGHSRQSENTRLPEDGTMGCRNM
jgi:hypothetical protein